MREDFENWYAERECYNYSQRVCWLVKESCGGYTYKDPNDAWKIWQAARSSLVVDLPTSISFGHDWLMNGKDVEDAIHATGVRTK